jgi:hypothetical protein
MFTKTLGFQIEKCKAKLAAIAEEVRCYFEVHGDEIHCSKNDLDDEVADIRETLFGGRVNPLLRKIKRLNELLNAPLAPA